MLILIRLAMDEIYRGSAASGSDPSPRVIPDPIVTSCPLNVCTKGGHWPRVMTAVLTASNKAKKKLNRLLGATVRASQTSYCYHPLSAYQTQ